MARSSAVRAAWEATEDRLTTNSERFLYSHSNVFLLKPGSKSLLDMASLLKSYTNTTASKRPKFYYSNFHIVRFRGVDDVSIPMVTNELVLLLGLNESGKTSILKGIEAFDFRNDPQVFSELAKWNRSLRNKAALDASDPTIIEALIEVEGEFKVSRISKRKRTAKIGTQRVKEIESIINDDHKILIQRHFIFRDGSFIRSEYKLPALQNILSDTEQDALASRIVYSSPFIIYFEDFTDLIPEKIYTSAQKRVNNREWYDILDGLFYDTDETLSLKKYGSYFASGARRQDDASSVMKRVNRRLNKIFTKSWSDLSGVKGIEETEIVPHYGKSPRYFEMKIVDEDGTTYSVSERSKGALWYLSFLMKTEFRRKKMRVDSGTPVFLIDEPASNLHSSAQKKMISDFQRLTEDSAVIYTTHSQYLVSKSNIKNTYIVQRDEGVVSATKWSSYVKGRSSSTTHYQPLADALNITPFNLEIGHENALITEGRSDTDAISVMYAVVNHKKPEFVIYPGTSASNLSALISLNIGWGSNFKVLLDSDREGLKNAAKYKNVFDLGDDQVITLSPDGVEMEDLIADGDKIRLFEAATGDSTKAVSKKQLSATLSVLAEKSVEHLKDLPLSDETIRRFKELFDRIGLG